MPQVVLRPGISIAGGSDAPLRQRVEKLLQLLTPLRLHPTPHKPAQTPLKHTLTLVAADHLLTASKIVVAKSQKEQVEHGIFGHRGCTRFATRQVDSDECTTEENTEVQNLRDQWSGKLVILQSVQSTEYNA
jgi:hypothetical protein